MELKITKQIETIEVKDDNDDVVLSWDVPTDDASIQQLTNKLANALSRAADLSKAIDDADSPEAAETSRQNLASLQKRVITAVLGDDAYDQILTYMGNGTPVDPMKNISNLGEIFAALCVWVYDHCTNEELRNAAQHLVPSNKQKRRRKRK